MSDFKPLSKNDTERLRARVTALEADLKRAEKREADANWAKSEAQASLRQEKEMHAKTKAELGDKRDELSRAETRHATLMAEALKKNGAAAPEKKTGWRVKVVSHDSRGRLEELLMVPNEPDQTKH